MRRIAVIVSFLLPGCISLPANVSPVTGFDAQRYLGTWHEIARLDHRFERGLEQVTATYAAREDGGITVTNRGFDTQDGEWSEATGRAYFVGARDTGFLKVSFFRPFYAPYVVFDLAADYRTAYVSSDGEDTLWFLARTPAVSPQDKDRFLEVARARGFDTRGIIWVRQQP